MQDNRADRCEMIHRRMRVDARRIIRFSLQAEFRGNATDEFKKLFRAATSFCGDTRRIVNSDEDRSASEN
jgi:hypothetical protein